MVYIYKPSWLEVKNVLMTLTVSCAFVVYVIFSSVFLVTGSWDYSFDGDKVIDGFANQNITWSYECRNNACIRTPIRQNDVAVSLETCSFMCLPLQFWPQPRNVSIISKNSSTFNIRRLSMRIIVPEEIRNDLNEAYNIFANNLPVCPNCSMDAKGSPYVSITINVLQNDRKVRLTTDESYSLQVTSLAYIIAVNITAKTYFGSRHALETLSQLIWYDPIERSLKIFHDILIEDRPGFPHRGLMIDTGRNFYPVALLGKVVDGMASCKLNVLHLHLTDVTSFPIVLPNNPGFAEAGAYSSENVYTPEDIKGLIDYARVRGIKVVLEIDAPSHVNSGWNQIPASKYGKMLICDDDPFSSVLNPDNVNSLLLLKDIYKDLLELGTDDEYFHLGADEVNTDCYLKTEILKKYQDVKKLWADYVNNMTVALQYANNNTLPKHVVIWSSDLTNSHLKDTKFDENLVVQFWYGDVIPVLNHGAKVVFSTVGKWYLDCGYGPWRPSMINAACGPYTPWQTFYEYRPWQEYFLFSNQVLGGEACLWSETIVPDSLEVRLWPRVAAMAERLWTDPIFGDINDVYSRLSSHRERMVQRNLKVDAIWPEWCTEHPYKCT